MWASSMRTTTSISHMTTHCRSAADCTYSGEDVLILSAFNVQMHLNSKSHMYSDAS